MVKTIGVIWRRTIGRPPKILTAFCTFCSISSAFDLTHCLFVSICCCVSWINVRKLETVIIMRIFFYLPADYRMRFYIPLCVLRGKVRACCSINYINVCFVITAICSKISRGDLQTLVISRNQVIDLRVRRQIIIKITTDRKSANSSGDHVLAERIAASCQAPVNYASLNNLFRASSLNPIL